VMKKTQSSSLFTRKKKKGVTSIFEKEQRDRKKYVAMRQENSSILAEGGKNSSFERSRLCPLKNRALLRKTAML